MKSGLNPKGFTIMETMIFLVVSMAILASSLTLLNGTQNKAQFTQAINDAQLQVDTIVKNVANGYYPKVSDFKCSVVNATSLVFDDTQVTNKGGSESCAFLGRVAQFTAGTEQITIYSVAGARYKYLSNDPVASMKDAIPTILPGTGNIQTINLKNGLTVRSVTTKDTAGATVTGRGAVGFFSNFGLGASAGGSNSSAQQGEFISIVGSSLSSDTVATAIADTSSGGFRQTYETEKNPASGIEICLDSGSTNQSGVITIGGDNRTATTTLRIQGAKCV